MIGSEKKKTDCRTPFFPYVGKGKRVELQQICTGLIARRGECIGEQWQDNKDTANDHLVQT